MFLLAVVITSSMHRFCLFLFLFFCLKNNGKHCGILKCPDQIKIASKFIRTWLLQLFTMLPALDSRLKLYCPAIN